MKIGFFRYEAWEKNYVSSHPLATKFSGRFDFVDSVIDENHLPTSNDFEVISIFVDSKIDRAVLDYLPNLKLIATRSTGFDHIDLSLCKERGVVVTNVPGYGENTVAEYAFALILCLSRKIFQSYHQVRETGSFSLEGLRGFDLDGKTLGVIGTGRIGKHVIKMAKGFEMKVIAFDGHPDAKVAEELGFIYLSLPQVLAQSDIISLHVPYLPETHHLINQETIKKIKPGAYLINTSRGAVVETEALVSALQSGALGGAGLDVLEEEGLVKDELLSFVGQKLAGHDLKTVLGNHLLIDMPNVIVTPHNAFNTDEAMKRIIDTNLENITNFIAGQTKNLVN
ncbi:MAG: hydroxyacid dehydrogenase [Patescibacteria group bacterium]